MIERFKKWMEQRGRKYVQFDKHGNILVEKYVLYGSRENGGKRKPSVVLHHFLRKNDKEFRHTHSGNYVSFMLYGSYTEEVEDGTWKLRLPFDIIRAKWTDHHCIQSVVPGTWTLFCMGKYQGPYLHNDKPHHELWHKVDADLNARLERLQARLNRNATTTTKEDQ